jgi:hypothetical protein
MERDIKGDKVILEIFSKDHTDSTKLMECAKRMAKKLGTSIQQLKKSDIIRQT